MTDAKKAEPLLWHHGTPEGNIWMIDGGGLGIEVGGYVIIKPLEAWFALGMSGRASLPDLEVVNLEPGELRPCPFCGGEAERLELDDQENFGGSVISCKKCGASSPVHFDRKEHLDSSWNERTALSSLPNSPGGMGERGAAIEECAKYVDGLAQIAADSDHTDNRDLLKSVGGDIRALVTAPTAEGE